MKQISDKTLAFLLIAAIIVSVGGTVISINRINRVMQGVTGLASSSTGKVNVTIIAVTSLRLEDSVVDFGSCSPNSTTGTNVSSNTSHNWGAPGVCTKAGSNISNSDNITVENDGNKNINVSISTGTAPGSTFIGGTDPAMYFVSRNASGRPGCYNVTGHDHIDPAGTGFDNGLQLNWRQLDTAGEGLLACTNLTFEDANDRFYIFFRLDLPPDAPVSGEQNVTVTLTASNW